MGEVAAQTAILIIDANALRRFSYARLLSEWLKAHDAVMLETTPAHAHEALEAAKNCRMVILSIGNERASGRGVIANIKFLRAVVPGVPLVVVSDREDNEDVVAAFAAGIKGYLPTGMAPQSALQALSFIFEGGSYIPLCALRIASPSNHREGGNRADQMRSVDAGKPGVESQRSLSEDASSDAEPDESQSEMAAATVSSEFARVERASPQPDRSPDKGGECAQAALFDAAVADANQSADGAANCDQSRPALSPRQQSILKCLISGESNKVIARKTSLSEATVKVHVKTILRKIQVRNRTQAAIWAMRNASEEGVFEST